MNGLNTIGARTLFLKEIGRVRKVWIQTVFSPLVTTCLYFLVFGAALGDRIASVSGVSYLEYLVPGLVTLAMLNNAFLNSSSSLFQSRMNGTMADIVVAPLGAVEIVSAYVAAAMVRGLVVGALVYAVSALFTGVRVHSLLWTLFFTLAVCATFGLLGLLTAIWAERFDHLSAVPSFVLTPLSFLGGVFYSVEMLPEPWSAISRANPMLYVVSGVRHGLIGTSDVPVLWSASAVFVVLCMLTAAALHVIARGYKLRS